MTNLYAQAHESKTMSNAIKSDEHWQKRAEELLAIFKETEVDTQGCLGSVRCVADLLTKIDDLKALCLEVCLAADSAKEKCSEDPDTPAAIRNVKFARIAAIAAKGLV